MTNRESDLRILTKQLAIRNLFRAHLRVEDCCLPHTFPHVKQFLKFALFKMLRIIASKMLGYLHLIEFGPNPVVGRCVCTSGDNWRQTRFFAAQTDISANLNCMYEWKGLSFHRALIESVLTYMYIYMCYIISYVGNRVIKWTLISQWRHRQILQTYHI